MMFLLPRKTAVRVVPKNKPDTIKVLSQAQGFPCACLLHRKFRRISYEVKRSEGVMKMLLSATALGAGISQAKFHLKDLK